MNIICNAISSTMFVFVLMTSYIRAIWGKEDEFSLPSSITKSTGDNYIKNGIASTTLSNGKDFPLVGLGVGSLKSSTITPLVAEATEKNGKTPFLLDTVYQNDNEYHVSSGIVEGVENMMSTMNEDEKVTIHVVTKVWYTHLGYERTKIAVRNTFRNLKLAIDNEHVNLKVHVILQWSRCYDSVDFMDCKGEENDLPDEIKLVGPPPHLSKANAWKESWKALEDMYTDQEYSIESIGVSNFNLKDMKQLELFASIQPHIYQMHLWSLLHDTDLIDYCRLYNIHVQVFNIIGLTVGGKNYNTNTLPKAGRLIEGVANELSSELPSSTNSKDISTAQVILAWLTQHGISVIPKTTKSNRLEENSAIAIARIPEMSDYQVESVAHSVKAFVSGQDIKNDLEVMVTFEARTRDLTLYWKRPDGSEVQVAYIPKGTKFNETTHPQNEYRISDPQNKDEYNLEYRVPEIIATTGSRYETVPL